MNLRLGFASAILACASLMACLVALTACGDKPPAPIAALLEGQGAVERGHGEAFASAPIGQPFFVGDAARTAARVRRPSGDGTATVWALAETTETRTAHAPRGGSQPRRRIGR